jgi:hypothetical protein
MIDAPQASALQFDQLLIETSSRQVFVQNQLIDFSTAEYDLLLLLAQHAGTVLSRDVILQHLRGIGYDGTDRSVDLRISHIRQNYAIRLMRGSILRRCVVVAICLCLVKVVDNDSCLLETLLLVDLADSGNDIITAKSA